MAGGAQRESTELRMTNRLAKFGSMTNDGIVELEWENGQILMRRHSSSHCRKAHVTNDTTDGNCNTKRPRLQALDSGMERSPLSLRDDYQYGEMFPGLYSNNFSKFFKNGRRSSYDEDIMESHVVPGSKSANPQPAAGGSSGLGSEMPQVTTGRKRQLHQGCSHKCKETVLLEGSILNGSQAVDSKIGFLNRKFQHLDARPDRRHFRFPNSSHFFRPPVFLEADDSQNRASTRPESCPSSSRDEEMKTSKEKTLSGGSNPFKSTILVELNNNGSTREERSLNQPVPTKTKMEQHSAPASKPHEGPPSDEQSEAVANENVIISKPCPDEVHFPTPSLAPPNGKPDARKYRDQLPETTSICSLVASNDPASSLRTVNEGAGGEMAYENEEVEEEPGGDRKAGTSRVSGGKGKRKRTAEVRNRFEKKRRDKINKKMRALQELLPKTGKVDKASMLDKAIEYLKTLQLQVQLMSIGTSLCMAPLVLPVGMQHLAPPHLTQFPPLGMGMDMREHMGGIGCSQMPYPTSPVLGLRNPMLSSAVLQAPAPGIPGGPATHTTPPAPGIPGVSAPGDFPVSGPLLGSNNAIQNINSALINNGDITQAPISHDELFPQIGLFQQSHESAAADAHAPI